ncbi:pantetheinase-like [Mizuhopecten yessoensis]|uniref:Pantetheinase n=1 Tax=Mizuhopecten yessoensis TaxID=6573 RepID=A0A210R4S7_MIZYE|nr:pantetheinase-like [Mizuhopecten yessoensis]OWF56040.1 Pantetheinase [Mizuhopecten yessoensis]
MECVALLLLILYVYPRISQAEDTGARTFRAAVYEHAVYLPLNRKVHVSRETALSVMMRNLRVYKEQTEIAASQGADIIVFPEDGVYGMGYSWDGIASYMEYIPEPQEVTWDACAEPFRFPNTEVQHFLSCLAKNNSIYLVANIGDKQPCDRDADPRCPKYGHYQFNTDVVYDPKGQLVTKYHKVNLFYESQFSFPVNKTPAIFDTPFGTFAVFTCFDIMFYDPAMAAIERYGVGNVIFPTAWMDALPLLSSIQFHSAFAAGLGINFLAANINFPSYNFHGSGIYTPDGASKFYYSGASNAGKLLVSDLKTVLKPTITYSNVTFDVEFPSPAFTASVFHDPFNFVPLLGQSGVVGVCHNDLCCKVNYSLSTMSDDVIVLGAFRGLHTYEGKYSIEVCAILKCKTSNYSSCGEVTMESNTNLTYLKFEGNFSVPYIFPEVLLSDNGSLNLAPIGSWSYVAGTLESKHGFDLPVLSTAMFARAYENSAGVVFVCPCALLVLVICGITIMQAPIFV